VNIESSLVVASALHANGETLYTEDLQDGQIMDFSNFGQARSIRSE